MRRRLFTLAAALSLLLCISSAALWPVSYFHGVGWRFFSQDDRTSRTSDLETVEGGIQFRQDVRLPYNFIVSSGPQTGK